jgi:protocatechuate 3,4-dioxygenase beta subunit
MFSAQVVDERITYAWVNNQGPNPAITFNWVEIPGTGTIVADGDDVFSEVELGFPFTFYGGVYTRTFVSSNGFVSFGSGSAAAGYSSIPDRDAPNNAIYAFWDDLLPNGGANGNVSIQRVSTSTFVIEWRRVKRYYSDDYETFEIILDGADNTIVLQYQTVSNASHCTVGVENGDGSMATQYAFATAGAVLNGLAVKFIPVSQTVYSISGTVREQDGTPVPGVQVSTAGGPVSASTYTSATGAYTLSVITGTYTVSAEKYYNAMDPPPQSVTVPPSRAGVDFVFPPRFSINGTVRDYDGTAVQSAWVRTYSGPAYASDNTDTTGKYDLSVIAGTYVLEANKTGYGTTPRRTVSVPPSRGNVDLTFGERYTVTGTVRDYDGRPLSGVYIRSDPSGGQGDTNANGQYALQLSAGLYCLSASLGDRPEPVPQAVLVPPSQSGVDFTFARAYTISGTVRDYDGTPMQNVYVSTSGGRSYDSDNTGAEGTYRLTVLAGSYSVRVTGSRRIGPAERAVTVPPDQTALDFTFARAYTVSGTARDVTGAPVSGVYVYLCPSEGGYCTNDTTNDSGLYSLLAPAGAWWVSAYKSGLPEPPGQEVTLPPAQTGVDFLFPVPAAEPYTIAGAVHDPDGNPLVGQRVRASTDCWDEECADTSAAGLYTITVSSPDIYLVEVGSQRRLATVPPNATGVDLVHPRLITITGSVRDAAGQPVAGALVQTTLAAQAVNADSGPDGVYILRLPPGTYSLAVSATGYASPLPRIVTVPPAQPGVDWVLPPAYRIVGVVRNARGDPVSYSRVRASGPSGSAEDWTSACGAYELFVAAGSYTVTVSAYGSPSQTVSVPPERLGVNFAVADGPVIAGVVRNYDGSPIESAYVWASGDSYYSAYTGVDGSYELRVNPGTYMVEVSKSGYPDLPVQTVSVPPDRRDLNFTFPMRYTVRGTVRDGSAQAVSLAIVTAENALCGGTAGRIQADASGAYTLALVAGQYDVFATQDNYAAIAQRVALPPAMVGLDFVIALPVRYAVNGTVRDDSGQPMADVGVYADLCGKPGGYTRTTANGSYILTVAAGTYEIDAWKEGYRSSVRTVTVAGVMSGIDLTLTPVTPGAKWVIYGYATDSAGNPIADVGVSAYSGPDNDSDGTGSCGRYRLTLHEPGTYSLAASKPGCSTVPTRTMVIIPPSRADVDFVLAPAAGIPSVSGVVRDGNGQPVASAEVVACPDGGGYCVDTVTDSAGRYSMTVPAGTHNLSARLYCYMDSRSVRITVPPAASADLTLYRITNRIFGRVSDYLGAPVYDAYVSASSSPGYASDWTDSNGDYLLRVPPGTWSLSVYSYFCAYARPPGRSVTVPPDAAGVNFTLTQPTPTGTAIPTPTRTRTPTPTPTNTPTRTPTPTATPLGPWIAWADGDAPLLVGPYGRPAAVNYGNISVSANLTGTLTGAAVLFDGSQQFIASVTAGQGSYAFGLKPATGAVPGDVFTLQVSLAGLHLERSGAIALQVYLPIICKRRP